MVITSPALLQKSPLHKKLHALQLPKLRQPQTIILSCTFDLIFFFRLCRLSKTDPMQKSRRYRQLPLNTYPDTAPTLDHTAGWVGGTQIHQTQFTSLLPSYLLKNSYSCLASGTVITKPGRGWTLLELENFKKDLGASFFFPLPHTTRISNFAEGICIFSYQRSVRAKTHVSLGM